MAPVRTPSHEPVTRCVSWPPRLPRAGLGGVRSQSRGAARAECTAARAREQPRRAARKPLRQTGATNPLAIRCRSCASRRTRASQLCPAQPAQSPPSRAAPSRSCVLPPPPIPLASQLHCRPAAPASCAPKRRHAAATAPRCTAPPRARMQRAQPSEVAKVLAIRCRMSLNAGSSLAPNCSTAAITCSSVTPYLACTAAEMRACTCCSICGLTCGFWPLARIFSTSSRIGRSSFSSVTALNVMISRSLSRVSDAGTCAPAAPPACCCARAAGCAAAACCCCCGTAPGCAESILMFEIACRTSGSFWCCLNELSIAFSETPCWLRIAPISWSSECSKFCWKSWFAWSAERLRCFDIFCTSTRILSMTAFAFSADLFRICRSTSLAIGASRSAFSDFFRLRRPSCTSTYTVPTATAAAAYAKISTRLITG
mmetsp:Transcript_19217/g.50514  ORF Transcript_19217/g.50514 Transcript_19217/m.50514 type:complete len:428 (+) Transcript_19217:353-1636(+)